MVFSIRIGVRPRDEQLRQQLDAEVERRQPEIQRLLASYGIPQVSAQNIAQGGN
jgi:hypothetical protein